MLFSAWPNATHGIDEIFSVARMADAGHWHGFWFADHYMPNTGDESVVSGSIHEAWAVLPAVAAITSRVRIGSLVSPTSVHHPAVLANRSASIDHISKGRFVLGLGAGWQINEHRAYGIELEAPGPRVSRFEEAIEVIRSMLDNETTSFDGDFYQLSDAVCDPKPMQDRLPIVVGTSGKRMSRVAAHHAQEWNTWGNPEVAGQKRAVFTRAGEDAGIDPASKHTSVQALFFVTDDDSKALAVRNDERGERSVAGSDAYVADQLGRYAELGFDEVIVPDFIFGGTPEKRTAMFERFSEVAFAS